MREPPYRRRETLIERLGFLFVQISCLGFSFPRPAIGFKQAGQAAGKKRTLTRVVSASAIACTRGKPQGSIRRPSLDSASHWLGAERDWREDTPYYLRVYTPYFIFTLNEYILLVIIVPYFYYTLLVYILLYRIYSFRIYPLKLFTSFIV